MKQDIKIFIIIPFLLFGCSNPSRTTEQGSATDIRNNLNVPAKVPDSTVGSQEPRPFKFTIDLDQFYEQEECNQETGECLSYKALGRKPEIVIHVEEMPGAAVKYDLDCDGDGLFEQSGLTSHAVCQYQEQHGKHQIGIRGALPGLILCGDDEEELLYGFSHHKALLSIDQWGDIRWKTMHAFAKNCQNIVIPDEAPDLADVTDMSEMFYGAHQFNQPIEHWNISSVTNLSRMFFGAFAFNQPLQKWNTANVKDISFMFMFCREFNQPLNAWNVSAVETMSGTFSMASVFNQPLDTWNVSRVKTMDGMFRGAGSFNQPLNAWDVSNVTDMEGMFNQATAFNQPLDKWNITGVRKMRAMFWGATAFTQNIDAWKVSAKTETGSMFQNSGYSGYPIWYKK